MERLHDELMRRKASPLFVQGIAQTIANPSHFAQLFRRETGLSPSDYRRQR